MDDDRWEARIWGDDVGASAERLIERGKPCGDQYRTDTYLLTEDRGVLVKLRDSDLFEIKRLMGERDGLQHWRKTVSLPFPLSADAAAPLLPGAPAHALTDAAALTRYAETLEGVRVRSVRKHRRRYLLGEAEAELTAVQAGDRVTQTLGIEAPNHDAAAEAARTLGLLTLPNTDYGTWLTEG